MSNYSTTAEGGPNLTAAGIFRDSIKEHWLLYLTGTLSLVLTSVTEVAAPKFIQWAVDTLTGANTVPQFLKGTSQVATLNFIVTCLFVTLLLAWFGRFVWRQTLARRSHQAGRDLKVGIWGSLRHQPVRTFQQYSLGDLMNRATGDLNAGRSIHGFTIVLTYDMIFLAILASASMLYIDWQLALYCLICFPFLPRFIIRLARREYTQHIWAQEKLSSLSDLVSQTLNSIRLQRATASESMWLKALDIEAKEYAQRRFEVLHTGLKMFPLGALPILLAYAVLLILGVQKIQAGTLTIGEFIALQSYVMILQIPLLELGDVISEWQRGFASLNRIVEIFNLGRGDKQQKFSSNFEKVLSDSEVLIGKSHETDFVASVANLSLSFDGMQRAVLKNITLKIPRGARIGICGPIGSGKSTLLSALSGLLEIPAGRVFLNGRDIQTLDRAAITSQVCVVPQKAFLFAGSIRYNLCLNETIADEALWRALDIVGLNREISVFKEGLDTWVGEWGINLSGGQKQRLALARALLRPRPLLLLDDCLSAVDAVTEEKILSGLSELFVGRTVIWVAHRPSTLRLCTNVYRIDSGILSALSADSLEASLSNDDEVGL